MLDAGDQAPDFSLPGTTAAHPDEVEEYTLSATLTQHPVLVNFYVFDFHPACRENLCELHDLSWFDLDADISVYGISTDSTYSHGEFARQEGFEYALLSDNDGSVAESYGVLADEQGGHRRTARRAVFVVDQDRTVQYAWVAESPAEQPEWEAIKRAVDALK
jgi:peroxiredoxin